jgi:ubiquinone/menaquinone biosynthesis C-methylase UbiE
MMVSPAVLMDGHLEMRVLKHVYKGGQAMAIDFHLERNRDTYAGRVADKGWAALVASFVDPMGKCVADIGCGGGIYMRAWHGLGARQVIGVDFSEQMVAAACENTAGLAGVSCRHGEATATGLPDRGADVVFQRALIHHLKSYEACFAEAHRVLAPGGVALIQDRTLADISVAGARDHIRGYFFECFPHLLAVEAGRRPSSRAVEQALEATGFGQIETCALWEVRRTYRNFDLLAQDLAARTGRSILHEINDAELEDLIAYIGEKISAGSGPIVEKDRWTLWSAHSGR